MTETNFPIDHLNLPEVILNPHVKHDFLLVIEANDSNPNGDPDADNQPRTDPETLNGLISDASIKRKIRDTAYLLGHQLFIQSERSLNSLVAAEDPSPPPTYTLSEAELDDEELMEFLEESEEVELEEGEVRPKGSDRINLKAPKNASKDTKGTIKKINDALKQKNTGTLSAEEREKHIQKALREKYYDVRMFGGVLATGARGAGRITGPVQITVGRSICPVSLQQHAITRIAKTTEARKAAGGSEFGRKHLITHGLYLITGQYSATTGGGHISADDLKTLWYTLANLYTHTGSAARTNIHVRGLYVFSHQHKLGNQHQHKLLETIQITPKDPHTPPTRYGDYQVVLPNQNHEVLLGKVTFTPVTHG